MKASIRGLVAVVTAVTLALGMFGCSTGASSSTSKVKSPLDPKNPTTITIWNYYNGDQLAAFDGLVSEFNASVGPEKGIIVESVSQGSIDNLANSLLDAANGKVGAQDMPTLAAVYAETAYILDKQDKLANLDDYFTEDELKTYIPGFIEEGRMTEGGPLLLFPVSKSTECFCVNETDWASFEQATGITLDSITTKEALTKAAEAYYNYTDAQTPDVANDGKALYGRDSVANYMYVGAEQLGHSLFEVTNEGAKITLDKPTLRTLWDNYYVPYVNGYFTAAANHRSDDVKTGAVIAMTGSTSAASYLPSSVTDSSDQTHNITLSINKSLTFENGSNTSVQQGAGYCVVKGSDQEQYAAAEFLKWLTDPTQNTQFSVSSGYSPVTAQANDAQTITDNFKANEKISKKTSMLDALLVSSDVYLNDTTYTCKPFEGSKEARTIIGDAMEKASIADRAAVVAAIEGGQSHADAVAPYVSDASFDKWYDSLNSSLQAVVK